MFAIICDTALADCCDVDARLSPISASESPAALTSAISPCRVSTNVFTEEHIWPISSSFLTSTRTVRSDCPVVPFRLSNAAFAPFRGFIIILEMAIIIMTTISKIV